MQTEVGFHAKPLYVRPTQT